MPDIPGLTFEARIKALRKSQDKEGDWCYIGLQVHPSDAQAMFLLPLGTAVDVTVQIAGREPEQPVVPVTEKPRHRFHEMSFPQQAGILCNNADFQNWLGANKWPDPVEKAAEMVRIRCHVTSRAQIGQIAGSEEAFLSMVSEYEQSQGRVAWQRPNT